MSNVTKKVGHLIGKKAITLHSGNALSIFDGRYSDEEIKDRKDKKFYFTSSLPKYSAKTHLLMQQSKLDDPVAAEMLVETEKRFANLEQVYIEAHERIEAPFDKIKNVIQFESYSSSPQERDFTQFNVYGNKAVLMLVMLDGLIMSCGKSAHAPFMSAAEAYKEVKKLKNPYESIITTPFHYKAKVTRHDFDAKNKTALDFLAFYRANIYIKQNDTRTDEELCLYYATYSELPTYF